MKLLRWLLGFSPESPFEREEREKEIALQYVRLWNKKHPGGPELYYCGITHTVHDEEWNTYPFIGAWEEAQGINSGDSSWQQ